MRCNLGMVRYEKGGRLFISGRGRLQLRRVKNSQSL